MASESMENLLQTTSLPEAVVIPGDQEPASSFLTKLFQKIRAFKDKHKDKHMATTVDNAALTVKNLEKLGLVDKEDEEGTELSEHVYGLLEDEEDEEDTELSKNVNEILTLLYAIVSTLRFFLLHSLITATAISPHESECHQ